MAKSRDETYEVVGTRIRTLRTQLGLTQAALARALSVSRASVSQWEAGVSLPRGANQRNLAKFLGLSVGQLLSIHDDAMRDDRELVTEWLDSFSTIDREEVEALLVQPEVRRILASPRARLGLRYLAQSLDAASSRGSGE